MPPGRHVARPVPPVRRAADALRLPLVPALTAGAVVLCVLLFGALVYAIAWALDGLTADHPEIEDDTPPLAGESWDR